METTLSQKSVKPLRSLLLGIVLGLLVGLTIWFIQSSLSKNQPLSPSFQKQFSLNLSSPVKNLATSEKNLSVVGNTGVKSIVAVTSATQTKIISSSSGSFSTLVELSEGKNVIKITAFDPTKGSTFSESREVLYLIEDLSNL